MQHMLFLGTIAERKNMPYDEIDVLNLRFNAIRDSEHLFSAVYEIKMEGSRFKISKKEIHF